MSVPLVSFGDESLLDKGIEQYRRENYEEAATILETVRHRNPSSSVAAFFLGLTYKQMMDYPRALENFKDAVVLQPRIKDALVELIEVLYRLGGEENLKSAAHLIQVAEREEIDPAKIAFLKGLLLQKEGKYTEAIEAFEKSESLDSAMTQAAEFQIGLAYVKAAKLEKAKERFRASVLVDPQSDLGSFARRYQDLVENQMKIERPIRLTLGLFGQYDSNLVLSWNESRNAPPPPSDDDSFGLLTQLRLDYIPRFDSPWLLNAQYAFTSNFHSDHSSSYDSIRNGFGLIPGYNFGSWSLNLLSGYDHTLLKEDGTFKRYLGHLRLGPLLRVQPNSVHLLELFVGYDENEFFREPLREEEDRDSDGLATFVNWVWAFKRDALFNARYEYIDANTDGIWWENDTYRFAAGLTLPIIDRIKLQLSGQAIFQEYRNNHLLLNNEKPRDDDIYQGTAGLTWEFFDGFTLVGQYSHTRADSNIAIYDYDRDLVTVGVEYRY